MACVVYVPAPVGVCAWEYTLVEARSRCHVFLGHLVFGDGCSSIRLGWQFRKLQGPTAFAFPPPLTWGLHAKQLRIFHYFYFFISAVLFLNVCLCTRPEEDVGLPGLESNMVVSQHMGDQDQILVL